VTALLEYLDLALITYSWFSHYNSLDWNSILLNHWRALQSWLIHPLTNFQLIVFNSFSRRSGILLVILDRIIITHCWFFRCIFMGVSSISFKPQKVWGSIVNLPLYKFSASFHSRFTLWAWQHIGVIFVNNHKYLCKCLSHSNQTWYQDVPLHHLSVHEIARRLDNPFGFYFIVTFTKRRKKKGRK